MGLGCALLRVSVFGPLPCPREKRAIERILCVFNIRVISCYVFFYLDNVSMRNHLAFPSWVRYSLMVSHT